MNRTEGTVDENSIAIEPAAAADCTASVHVPILPIIQWITRDIVGWSGRTKWKINKYARKCKRGILDAQTAAWKSKRKKNVHARTLCIDNWFDLLATDLIYSLLTHKIYLFLSKLSIIRTSICYTCVSVSKRDYAMTKITNMKFNSLNENVMTTSFLYYNPHSCSSVESHMRTLPLRQTWKFECDDCILTDTKKLRFRLNNMQLNLEK